MRYLLADCGVDYEERIITKEMLAELRSEGHLLFQQLPLLEIDGLKLVQSGAIIRYLARKFNLYGNDDREAVICDMVVGGLNDFLSKFLGYPFANDKEVHIRDNLLPFVSRYLKPLEEMITNNKGSYLLGNHVAFPDFLFLELLEYINEILPTTLEEYPCLKQYYQAMRKRPNMKKFYESGQHYPLAGQDYVAHVKDVLGRK